MSHLGDRLSALVDGELDGAERDRVHSHLASCEPCRAEAAELRALKRKLGTLPGGAPSEAAMTRRLIAMTGPGGPPPARRHLLRIAPGHRLPGDRLPGKRLPGKRLPGKRPPAERMPSRPGAGPPRSAPRHRYLVLGTVSLVVSLGTVAFTVGGGGDAAPGPRITPPVEMYSVEHAITTGEVPFAQPSAMPVSSAASASASASALDTDAPPP